MGPLCLSLYLIKKREAKAKVISEKQKQWQFHFYKDKFVRAEAGPGELSLVSIPGF